MAAPTAHTVPPQVWDILRKEIAGIQFLWETMEGLCLRAKGQGLVALEKDVPLLRAVIQTALMESLLMRTARLMDRARSSRGQGERVNLSLKYLVQVHAVAESDVAVVQNLWNASKLRIVRDRYLSHNDLERSLTEPHTVNVPLDDVDVAALRELVDALRRFLRQVHEQLWPGLKYLDETVSLDVQRELDVLDRWLQAGELFFQLLPESEVLRSAWAAASGEKV